MNIGDYFIKYSHQPTHCKKKTFDLSQMQNLSQDKKQYLTVKEPSFHSNINRLLFHKC